MPTINFGLTHPSKFPELTALQEQLAKGGISSETRTIYSSAGPNEVFQIALTIEDWKAFLGTAAALVFHGALGEAGKDLYKIIKQTIQNTPSHLPALGRVIHMAVRQRLEPEFCIINEQELMRQKDVRFSQKISITGDTSWDIASAINSLVNQPASATTASSQKHEKEFDETALFKFLSNMKVSLTATGEPTGLTTQQTTLLSQCLICQCLSEYGSINLTEDNGIAFSRVEQTQRYDGPKDVLVRVAALNMTDQVRESDLFKLANTNAAIRLLISSSSSFPYHDPLIRKLFWRPGCPSVYLFGHDARAAVFVPSSGRPNEVFQDSTGVLKLHPCG